MIVSTYKWSVLSLLGSLVFFNTSQSFATEIIEWKLKPLVITLPVNQEKIIEFNRNIRAGLPASIAGEDTLRVQSTGGALYLKAFKSFSTERVRVQDIETGEMILLDLSAGNSGTTELVKVTSAERDAHVKKNNTNFKVGQSVASKSEVNQEADVSDKQGSTRSVPVPVLLTRYAAQSLYSPLRAVEPVAGLRRIPMKLSKSLPIMPALPVDITPVAAWKSAGLSVTALKIRNLDQKRMFDLDPRWIQAQAVSATFMHRTLGVAGSVEDTTTLFLVTEGTLTAQAKKWGW